MSYETGETEELSLIDDQSVQANGADPQMLSHSARSRFLTYFYLSHFLSRWGSRMWEFGVGLFMVAIFPHTLLFASLYGFVEDISVVVLGVSVGKWIDKAPRLKAVQISLGVRNGSIMAAAFSVAVLLVDPNFAIGNYKLSMILVTTVNIFGGLSAVAVLATNIAVERDWVIAIAAGGHVATLEELNSVMRTIDLTCQLVAPIIVGITMSCVSVLAAAVLLSLWNVVSIGFEYYLLKYVYDQSPELKEKDPGGSHKQETVLDASVNGNTDSSTVNGNTNMLVGLDDIGNINEGGVLKWIMKCFHKALLSEYIGGWKAYAKQSMLLAALALAILYFTVLSFGSLMTAALNSKGIPAFVLAVVRGISALSGIAGAVAYPKLHNRVQALRVGLWSITIQWILLSLSVISVWIPNNVISSVILMTGVAASRFGLWMFDLAVLQLMQESIPESDRGTVGGAQNTIQSFLEMLAFSAGMVIPNPKDFGKLVCLSYGAVTLALILYSVQVYRIRGHLFHRGRHLFHRGINSEYEGIQMPSGLSFESI